VRVLADMDEAEREAALGALSAVAICGYSSLPFGMRHIMPLVPRFLAQNPEITLDLVFSDTVVHLMQERADVAIRDGPFADVQARSPC